MIKENLTIPSSHFSERLCFSAELPSHQLNLGVPSMILNLNLLLIKFKVVNKHADQLGHQKTVPTWQIC